LSTRRERRRAVLEQRRRGQQPPQQLLAQYWRSTVIWGVVALVAIGIIAFLLLQPKEQIVFADQDASPTLPGTYYPPRAFIPDLEQHMNPGQVYDNYSSNPPTSGPHDPSPVKWGIYEEPQPKEKLVHNMEHGGVVIWYNCPGCTDLIENLKRVAQDYLNRGGHIVMTPYPSLTDARIGVTAWTRLDKMMEFDEARIRRFIEVHEGRFNPEDIPSSRPPSGG